MMVSFENNWNSTQRIFFERLRYLTQVWTSDSRGIGVFPDAKIDSSFCPPCLPLSEVTNTIPGCSESNWYENKLYVNEETLRSMFA